MNKRILDALLLKGFCSIDDCVKSVAPQIRITAWVLSAIELLGHQSAGILLVIVPTWLILLLLSFRLEAGLDHFKKDV